MLRLVPTPENRFRLNRQSQKCVSQTKSLAKQRSSMKCVLGKLFSGLFNVVASRNNSPRELPKIMRLYFGSVKATNCLTKNPLEIKWLSLGDKKVIEKVRGGLI